MIEYAAKTPKIPIPFNKLLKVVALVDAEDREIRRLLDHLEAEKFEVEVSNRYDRDPSEDADVGAYIIAVDGERREPARKLAQAIRAIGFRAPLWALADSHRISDVAVLGGLGEVDGYVYLGQQTPAFYAKQIIASIVGYGMSLLPPFFGGLMAYDAAANVAFDCPGRQCGQFYRKSPAGQLFFKHFGEKAQPMLDYFHTFEESFNRFPGFNYEVQGVYQEIIDGRIKFYTYAVRE
jgi:ornithine decarboxylase